MIRVVADPDVESALPGVMEPAKIRGCNGELLGYFCPCEEFRPLLKKSLDSPRQRFVPGE